MTIKRKNGSHRNGRTEAYRGYLLTGTFDCWYITKDGHNIGSALELHGCMQQIDELLDPINSEAVSV